MRMHETHQRDIQEIKNSIESWQNLLNQTEGRLLDLEGIVVASDQERKALLKTERNQKVTIQELQDDAKKNNIRLTGISKRSRNQDK